ncbi:RNA polymerase sigma factor RpoH [Tardiphaga sp. 42S5]|uniref:RNA polymerase sigma factor RpoH n=1 Tax=Tardiphaga sp. 42S5 TaxID=1404799 RepID=UPI002A5AC5B5|nr:RNA polymerase sigma factor RpoH [Tardiphaga sp. 42S5]WPO39329.1 RNA polymerase sigma factor RpoH [Tardiphaga sp. 42S5]
MSSISLPMLADGSGLTRYLTAIKQFPLLSPEQEVSLARKLRERDDREAAFQLVTSHLRLVAKIAMRYRGYGLPIADVISEGNIGLMQAVKRFDPDRGFRLATYATWWIKATIQDYILRSWSIVKIAASSTQKRLFFNLRRLKSKIAALDDGDMRPEQVATIAARLYAPEHEVIEMNRRFMGDMSLNAKAKDDDEAPTEWQDRLADDVDLEQSLVERSESEWRTWVLRKALDGLSAREQRIIEARWLSDAPATLDELGIELGVSRERVRQIETRALEKARRSALSLTVAPQTVL